MGSPAVAVPQMGGQAPPAAPKPVCLRDDLMLHPTDPDRDGSPAWVLQDPLSNRFFRIGWLEAELLPLVSAGGPERIAALATEGTGRAVETEDVRAFLQFLVRHDLVRRVGDEDRGQLLEVAGRLRRARLQRLAKQYLFIRLPLVRPDRFLDAAMPLVSWCFSRLALWSLIGIGLAGLYLTLRQFDLFVATALDFLSVRGLVYFAVGMVLVKILHELGHAFAARRFGCRVNAIGVALIIFWPVLYTDVSDAWKLRDRRARLAIGAAGLAVDLAVACVALFLWAILPPGVLRDLCFVLATASWITSLAINLNPFMRFDGYYLLSDLWRIPNLHARALALARWRLSEFLFGLGDRAPEPPIRGLALFGTGVALYRVLIMMFIVGLLYAMFFKLLALALMVMVLLQMVLLPLLKGLSWTWSRRADLRPNLALLRTLALLALLAALFLLPWRSTVEAPGVLQARDYARVFAPVAGRISSLDVGMGDTVAAGEVLLNLVLPDLDHELAAARREAEILRWQISVQTFERDLLERNLVLEGELLSLLDRIQGYEALAGRNRVAAPFAGEVTELQRGLGPGSWVAEGEPLMALVDRSTWHLLAYVAEEDLARISEGAAARFYPRAGGLPPMDMEVVRIESLGLRELDQPHQSAVYGGDIPVRAVAADGGSARTEGEALRPVTAVYRVWLEGEVPVQPTTRATLGRVLVTAAPESLFSRAKRHLLGVARRETGF